MNRRFFFLGAVGAAVAAAGGALAGKRTVERGAREGVRLLTSPPPRNWGDQLNQNLAELDASLQAPPWSIETNGLLTINEQVHSVRRAG